MRLDRTTLKTLIREEISKIVEARPRARDNFWTVAPRLEETLKGKLLALASRPQTGDAGYRAELRAACESILRMLDKLDHG